MAAEKVKLKGKPMAKTALQKALESHLKEKESLQEQAIARIAELRDEIEELENAFDLAPAKKATRKRGAGIQPKVLEMLSPKKGKKPSEIAEALGLEPTPVNAALQALAKKGQAKSLGRKDGWISTDK